MVAPYTCRSECYLFFNAHQSISSHMHLGIVSRNSTYPGYSGTFPYIVVCMGLYCDHSCWHTGFSSLKLKVQCSRCSLFKISNSLNTLPSARFLMQVFICILKSWFPQADWNWFGGNPLTIPNTFYKKCHCISVNVFLHISLMLLLQYSNKNWTIMLFETREPHKFI